MPAAASLAGLDQSSEPGHGSPVRTIEPESWWAAIDRGSTMESPTVADEAVPYQNPNRVYVMVQGVHWTLSLSHADFLSSPYRTARDTAQALRGEVMIFFNKGSKQSFPVG